MNYNHGNMHAGAVLLHSLRRRGVSRALFDAPSHVQRSEAARFAVRDEEYV
jgi:hypothetical protein